MPPALFYTLQLAAGLFDDVNSPDHREFLNFTLCGIDDSHNHKHHTANRP